MKLTLLSVLFIITSAAALNQIVIKGSKFFDSVTKEQFYIKGVAYQPVADPIANLDSLNKDIKLLKEAGINLIRCYQTDWTLNHTQGMSLLAENGIYVLIDLGDPNYSISYNGPWSTTIFENMRRKAAAFFGFSNLLGFISANEPILKDGSTINAAYVKAATRDMKRYIKDSGYKYPVGYAAADVNADANLADYLNCNSVDESVDFYGVNIYRWCGLSNAQNSGYSTIAQKYSTYSIPYFFTEYGCNTVSPRQFTEVQSIYGPDMENTLSGGIVYEWHQEANKYGLVVIESDGSRTILPDYNNFKAKLTAVTPKILNMDTYTPVSTALQPCPAIATGSDPSRDWSSQASPLPPTPKNPQCQCMMNSLNCRTNIDIFVPTNGGLLQQVIDTRNIVCGGSRCYPTGGAPQFGSYGPWSFCNEVQKAALALDDFVKTDGSRQCGGFPLASSVQNPTTAIGDCFNLAQNYSSFSIQSDSAIGGGSTGSGGIVSPGNGGGSIGDTTPGEGSCGNGLKACGNSCYKSSEYCCSGGVLIQLSLCPSVITSTTSSTSADRSITSSTSVGTSDTVNPIRTSAGTSSTSASLVNGSTFTAPQNSQMGSATVISPIILLSIVLSVLSLL